MKNNMKNTPQQVAYKYEVWAQQSSDKGHHESARSFMEPCLAIRRLLRTLSRLNDRVHSGYDFNADPDGMTKEVGDLLADEDAAREAGGEESHEN